MIHRPWIGCILVALLVVVGLPYSTGAAQTAFHSGSLVALDPEAGTIALEEVGPWRVERGATVTMRRTIIFTRWTDFTVAKRVPDAPSGFAGDFVEAPLEPRDVKVGDFVTAEVVRDAKRLIALKVTVTRVSEE